MGKKDITLKEYLSDPRRYADLLNGSIFQGRQIIAADELLEADTVQSKSDSQSILERINDITMKQTRDGSLFAIWTVANQEYIDYGMPVRVMMQDALAYDRQLKKLKRFNKTSASSEAFLSQLRSTDRLHPVITLVVYWGEGEWQGARSMHDILDFGTDTALAKELKLLVPEYPLHFLNLSEVHNYESFQTELRTLFELYDHRNDKEAFSQYLKEHDECRHIDSETCWALGVLLKATRFRTVLSNIERVDDNMSSVLDEIIEDLEKEAIQRGMKKGMAEGLEKGLAEGLEKGLAKGLEKGLSEGLEKGTKNTLYSLVHDGLLSIQDAAARIAMTESAFAEEMENAGY